MKVLKLYFSVSKTVPLSTERYPQVHPKSPNSKVKVLVLAGVLFRVKQASASQVCLKLESRVITGMMTIILVRFY